MGASGVGETAGRPSPPSCSAGYLGRSREWLRPCLFGPASAPVASIGGRRCEEYSLLVYQEWDPCAGTGGIWQSEHDFRDKHASQFTTGRFVLLPKNLVTGAAKARIVSRPTRPANAAQVTGR
jgi:hypothetical protein